MSGSTPSPVSDESSLEGCAIGFSKIRNLLTHFYSRRAFVNEAIANDRLAAVSPRSALLSHSSLQSSPVDEQSTGGALIDSGRQLRKRSTNASTGHRRKRGTGLEMAKPSALSQLLEVDISRKDPRDEVMRLREILKTVERQAVAETRRTRELERANQDALRRVRLLNESNLAVQLEAAKANQELRLYQLRLDNAQKEIEISQDAVKKIERERDEAEAEAARAKAKARKLHQERVAAAAREEGRRLGFEAGFEYAKHERQAIMARRPPSVRQKIVESRPIDKGKRRARDREDFQPAPQAPPPQEEYINESPLTHIMSPSQLPLRGFPEMDLPRDPRPIQAGPSHGTPLRPFEPYPESERGYDRPPEPDNTPLPMHPPPQQQQQQQPPRSKTPSIQKWTIEIPSQEELSHDYNTVENPNEIIKNLPREQWVTAQTHRELRGPPPTFPGNHPPPLLPYPPKPPSKRVQLPPPIKFPKMKRPSLAKTKEQAASWYRSLSFRKKNKPIIDPIPEESVVTPTTGDPRTGSTFNAESSEPATATTTGDPREVYGAPPRPSASWYASKQQPPILAPSVKSGYSRASTRVSEFDLLATPDVPAQSVRTGKEGPARRMKEKDSYLSVIKEDPASRGNTPERQLPRARASASSFGQPNFSQHSLHQQSSSGAIGSSVGFIL